MRLASDHLAVPLSGAELERQEKVFHGYTTGLVRLTPGGWLFPGGYTKFADSLYNYQFRASDVLVMTYPKCGTTWTQEIVWTMRSNPDLNHPKTCVPINNRSPFIEMDMLLELAGRGEATPERAIQQLKELDPEAEPRRDITLQLTSLTPDPRTIKTHLPFSLLTPHLLDTTKVVYVARNPKDVCVSFCHHSRIIKGHGYVGTLDEFVQFLVDGDLMYGPYWEHLREAWLVRDHPNMHFIYYEDLKADVMAELDKLNTFLGTSLTATQLQQVAHHTSFSQMKAREEAVRSLDYSVSRNMEVVKKDGSFFRKGETGSWRTQLTASQVEKIDQWTRKNAPKLGPSFKYSL